MPQNRKVRVRLVSLQTAEHCCVSRCLFSVSCVHCTVMTVRIPDHSKGTTTRQVPGRRNPGLPWAGITSSASKLFPRTHRVTQVGRVGHSHIFILRITMDPVREGISQIKCLAFCCLFVFKLKHHEALHEDVTFLKTLSNMVGTFMKLNS